jgi:hypothetical protein
MRTNIRTRRPTSAAVLLMILLLVAALPAGADTTGVGGIVTGMTSIGSSGKLAARITNPFNLTVSGYINFTTQNTNGGVTTTKYQYSLGPYGSQNFDASNPSIAFTSSSIGAQLSDLTGSNTATGYGTSSAPSCGGTPCDGGGGGGHGGTPTIPQNN